MPSVFLRPTSQPASAESASRPDSRRTPVLLTTHSPLTTPKMASIARNVLRRGYATASSVKVCSRRVVREQYPAPAFLCRSPASELCPESEME